MDEKLSELAVNKDFRRHDARRPNRHNMEENDRSGTAQREPFLEIGSILGHAYLECVISTLRFGCNVTGRIVKGQSEVWARMPASQTPEEFRERTLRMAVDEARGCLRDVLDLASHEFRGLQEKLGSLQEQARAIVRDAEDSKVYTRRWKAKP